MFNPQLILVPTDFSESTAQSSRLAALEAVSMAEQSGASLLFLHVIAEDVARKPFFFLDDDKIQDLRRRYLENAKNELEAFAKRYVGRQNVEYITRIREGVPYNEILAEQKDSGADLVVISTRGMSGLQEFFFGSTTEKVVRWATCNVLVVRHSHANF